MVGTITKTAKGPATKNLNVEPGSRQIASENNDAIFTPGTDTDNTPQGNVNNFSKGVTSNTVGGSVSATPKGTTVGTLKPNMPNNRDSGVDRGKQAGVWSVAQLQNFSRNPGTISGSDYYSFRESLQSKKFVYSLFQKGIKVVNPNARAEELQEFGATKNPRIICIDMGNRYRCQRNAR